jgi:hypothetical protein
MGDRYAAGQAGAQGPSSHAHDISFTQIWNQAAGSISLTDLAQQLSLLRTQLRSHATTAEQDAAVGAVASAEMAARNGDGPKAFQHLRDAGKWTLDIAIKLGTEVAAAAIRQSLGLP